MLIHFLYAISSLPRISEKKKHVSVPSSYSTRWWFPEKKKEKKIKDRSLLPWPRMTIIATMHTSDGKKIQVLRFLYRNYNIMELFFCSEHRIFSTTRVSSIFSLYLFIWLYMVNALVKYSEIFFDSSMCNFSKSPCSFHRRIFLILSALWFNSCKTSHACLMVVTLATISKVASSRHC